MTRVPGFAAVALLALSIATPGTLRAQAPVAPPAAPAPAPDPTPPGARFDSPAAEDDDRPSQISGTWLWIAAGGVIATTATILLLLNSSEKSPKSTLGNMNAFKATR